MAGDSERQSSDNKNNQMRHMGGKKKKKKNKRKTKHKTKETQEKATTLLAFLSAPKYCQLSTPKDVLDNFLAKHRTLLTSSRNKATARHNKGSNRSRTRALKAAVVVLAPAASFFLTRHKAIG